MEGGTGFRNERTDLTPGLARTTRRKSGEVDGEGRAGRAGRYEAVSDVTVNMPRGEHISCSGTIRIGLAVPLPRRPSGAAPIPPSLHGHSHFGCWAAYRPFRPIFCPLTEGSALVYIARLTDSPLAAPSTPPVRLFFRPGGGGDILLLSDSTPVVCLMLEKAELA